MRKLNIFYNNDLVGSLALKHDSDEMVLHYSEYWKENEFSLSPALPLDGSFSNTQVKNFIENLLPEGNGLDMLISYLHISKTNKFGLIKALGKDTSGALVFISPETETIETNFREISIKELAQRIRERKSIPISMWDGKPRLSIAGVQEKLPVTIIDGKYGFGEGKLSSTHILKFEKENQNLVLNEYLSLHLAKTAGLRVANASIKYFEDQQVLEVERFDREIISNKEIKKIHMIDTCQALCLPVSYKYERNFGSGRDVKEIREGVSFSKLQSLIKMCSTPIMENKRLLEWTMVNLCLGNCDAHGKNISFFKNKNKMELTPFYDIVNISLYENEYETDLAMAISDEFEIESLKPYDFIEFSEEIQIKTSQLKTTFNTISSKILKELDKDFIINIKEENPEFVNKYITNIKNRIEKLKIEIENSVNFS